ncbi:hypothetical protein ITJ43_11525 [Microbacterium sp. VKM Ac-2870]|uniref:hypothetical protein n=1 Tax=Microbacterium sp. VKM Ac-2870 TaxID=2783825 RepID=UPI001889D12B|nr:hypothetical protein [Microbacterium sp. VKM Ac-2870]MBF4562770.1 hypothetical protein [Microbacterium sp. VKM Ac-2870]
MSIIDPDQSPLDPDTALPQEPERAGDDDILDPIGEDVRDGIADGDVLTDPDLPLDGAPDGAAGPA